MQLLRQMSLGKAAGEDEVTAELLRFAGPLLWIRWLGSVGSNAAPGAEVVWPSEWCIGLVVPLWKRKGKRTRTHGGVLHCYPLGRSCWLGSCNSSSFLVRRSRRICINLGFVAVRGLTTRYRLHDGWWRRLLPAMMMERALSFHSMTLKRRIPVFVGELCGIFFLSGVAILLYCVSLKCCTEARHIRRVCMEVVLGNLFRNAALGRGSRV